VLLYTAETPTTQTQNMRRERNGPDEQPTVSTRLDEVLKKGPAIHSFVIHPDGSAQDVTRRRPRSEGGRYTTSTDFAEAARDIRDN